MIVVFGSVNLDLIFPLPALPAPGETVLTPTLRVEPGGKGANQALAAARDGARVVMAGAVGRDALADAALALLREAGADLSRVIRAEAPTGCAGIFVDPAGRNAIGVGSGANLAASADQVEDALLRPGTTVLMQMEVPAEQNAALIARARQAGCRLVLNLAPAGPIARETLRALDLLVVNESEASWLVAHLSCEDSAALLFGALGGPVVVRTLGEQGAEAAGPGLALKIPARKVDVVDTTAAGDCFTGVLASALDRGMALEGALRRASVAAALCCTRSGSQATMPLATETDAALSQQG
jgi:ribokinase